MTDEEIEVVAEELAKLVHVPWAPGYETTPLLDVVTECHRAEARAILAALDQIRPGRSGSSFQAPRSNEPQGISCQSRSGDVRPGMTVIYRPPGEQRAYPCRIVKSKGTVPTWLLFSGPASDGCPSNDFRSRRRKRSRIPKHAEPCLLKKDQR
jgi:hypothetical protein